jgi:hypothetical protein
MKTRNHLRKWIIEKAGPQAEDYDIDIILNEILAMDRPRFGKDDWNDFLSKLDLIEIHSNWCLDREF